MRPRTRRTGTVSGMNGEVRSKKISQSDPTSPMSVFSRDLGFLRTRLAGYNRGRLMPLAPGTKLGPYEVASHIGAGGMGEVYRARDTRLGRDVAIKVLPTHLSSDSAKARFEREAKAISALNHPNICTLHDVGSQDGTDYLVMEFLDGQSLHDRLQKGPIPVDQVLKIGREIADALDIAHRNAIVHRDLKPGNVMLTKSGAKLLDFGLARTATQNASLATLTAVT